MCRWGQFPCSTPIRDRISAPPPHGSLNTRPGREIVYPENNREMLPKLFLESKQNMKTNPIYTSSGYQKTWTIQNRYGYRYAKICIFPTVSLLNGRRLARLHHIRTSYGKRGVGCLTLLSCKVTSQGRWRMIASPATKEHNSVNCKFRQHLPCTVR